MSDQTTSVRAGDCVFIERPLYGDVVVGTVTRVEGALVLVRYEGDELAYYPDEVSLAAG
jgi:hypothetical protein